MTEKRCPECKETKPLDEFDKSAARRDGYHCYCKPCRADIHRFRRYGLTKELFLEFLKKQKERCPLCKRRLNRISWTRATVVDHDHETGEVRGILCVSCNRVLGYLENNAWYNRACDYLGWS